MIVVPSFAEREHGDPEIVLGGVLGEEPPRSPHVGGRIYEPSGMKTDHRSQEDRP